MVQNLERIFVLDAIDSADAQEPVGASLAAPSCPVRCCSSRRLTFGCLSPCVSIEGLPFFFQSKNLGLHSRVQHLEHLMLFSCYLASQSAPWRSSDATLFWSWPFLALLRRVLVRTTQSPAHWNSSPNMQISIKCCPIFTRFAPDRSKKPRAINLTHRNQYK